MARSHDTRPEFARVTEMAGTMLSREGAAMIYARYHYAAELVRERRVLEIGCGSGVGFALLSRRARQVIGGDPDRTLLTSGRRHYGARLLAAQLVAEALPFGDARFDVVLCLEALYYVRDAERAFDEMARVLAPGGTVLIVSANPERPDFIPSPHSRHYHTADELRATLRRRGFAVRVEGAYSVDGSARARTLAAARRLLSRLGLVPKTLRGRAVLKRLAYGRLVALPAELPEGFAVPGERVELGDGPARGFKVLYVTARLAS